MYIDLRRTTETVRCLARLVLVLHLFQSYVYVEKAKLWPLTQSIRLLEIELVFRIQGQWQIDCKSSKIPVSLFSLSFSPFSSL